MSDASSTTPKKVFRVAVVHGPNLNLLGSREPEIYGSATLAEVDGAIASLARKLGVTVQTIQSNSEGTILDFLAEVRHHTDGIVINPAGLGHSSVALLDCLLAISVPFVEVHLSNPAGREPFRQRSFTAGAALGVVAGFGLDGYLYGLRGIHSHLQQKHLQQRQDEAL